MYAGYDDFLDLATIFLNHFQHPVHFKVIFATYSFSENNGGKLPKQEAIVSPIYST